MWKKKKVRAGVLLYAVTIAGIFSLLLQFYLNRQVAHHQDYALNKEKLLAFAMAKRTYEKSFITTVNTGKNQFEFHFSPLKKTGQKSEKTENKTKEGNEEKKEEGVKKETARSSKLAPSKKDTE